MHKKYTEWVQGFQNTSALGTRDCVMKQLIAFVVSTVIKRATERAVDVNQVPQFLIRWTF